MMRIAMVGALALLTAAPAAAGERTERVQAILEGAGYQPGPVDGLYGPRSRNAVREFQRANGLPAHGWLDRATREHLAGLGIVLGEVLPVEEADAAQDVDGAADVDARRVRVTDPPGDEDREAVIELYAAATADEPAVRIAAIRTLGEVRTERAEAALGVVLLTDADPALRILAARELGSYRTDAALQMLVRALDFERDPHVREAITAEIDGNLPVQVGTGPARDAGGARLAAHALLAH